MDCAHWCLALSHRCIRCLALLMQGRSARCHSRWRPKTQSPHVVGLLTFPLQGCQHGIHCQVRTVTHPKIDYICLLSRARNHEEVLSVNWNAGLLGVESAYFTVCASRFSPFLIHGLCAIFASISHGLSTFFRPLLTPVSAAPSLPASQFTVGDHFHCTVESLPGHIRCQGKTGDRCDRKHFYVLNFSMCLFCFRNPVKSRYLDNLYHYYCYYIIIIMIIWHTSSIKEVEVHLRK